MRRTCSSRIFGSLSLPRAATSRSWSSGIMLQTEKELGRNQESSERGLDTPLEGSLAPTLLVEPKQRLDVGIVDRSAIGAPREGGQNLLGARFLIIYYWY